ncbi:MAG: hypothetical protein K6A40_11045 [Solobacterium sp.]|nr:hypothetical protein [Solobacterium sp.]
MTKNSDFQPDQLPSPEETENEPTLILPTVKITEDEVSRTDGNTEFRTEEILTLIEKRISEEPKHRRRNRIKDVFRKKKQ